MSSYLSQRRRKWEKTTDVSTVFSGDLYLFNLDANSAFVSGVIKHLIHLCSRHHMVHAHSGASSALLAGASRPPRPCSRAGGHTRWPSRSCEDTGRGAQGDVLAGETPEAQPAWKSLCTVALSAFPDVQIPLGRSKGPTALSPPLCLAGVHGRCWCSAWSR